MKQGKEVIMANIHDFRDLQTPSPSGGYSSSHTSFGIPISKQSRLSLYSSNEWEMFTEEWAHSLIEYYKKVRRFASAGDKGLDVVGFCTENNFDGEWDNYQCKHYDHPLTPSDIWPEISKVIYYTHIREYSRPRRYYFVAPKGIGTKLNRLLTTPSKLMEEVSNNWPEDGITSTATIPLIGSLRAHFESFNFSIFSSKSSVELIAGHSNTPFHAVRFGGGLPQRPEPDTPPEEIQPHESRYVAQLMEAYGEHLRKPLDRTELSVNLELTEHFQRQRELFFHAESLRGFSRDTMPTGIYEDLQNEVYHGVIDVCINQYENGYYRVKATLSHAAIVDTSTNPLSSAVKVQDKQGICHQLSNDDRLIWVQKKS